MLRAQILLMSLMLSTFTKAKEQESFMESPRSLGRGGTFVAANDSDEAVFLNPATLAESNISYQLRWLQFDSLIGVNTIDTISDLLSLASSNEGLGFLKKFEQKFGEKQYVRGQFSFLAQRFGSFEISPFSYSTSSLTLGTPFKPSMKWNSDTAAGINLTYAHQISKTISLGLTIRPLYRWHIAGEMTVIDLLEFIPPSSTSFEDFSPITSGTSIGSDIGFIWSPSPKFRWGILVQNIGDSRSTQKNGSEPPAYRQKISTGALVRQSIGKFIDIDLHADIQGLTNRGLRKNRL